MNVVNITDADATPQAQPSNSPGVNTRLTNMKCSLGANSTISFNLSRHLPSFDNGCQATNFNSFKLAFLLN